MRKILSLYINSYVNFQNYYSYTFRLFRQNMAKLSNLRTLLLVVLLTFSQINLVHNQTVNDNEVSVIGTAKLSLQPDVVYFLIGISSTQTTSQAAAAKTTQKLNKIIQILTKVKVSTSDVTKYELSINSEYQMNNQGQPQFIGQTARQTIKIILRNGWKNNNLISIIIDQINLLGVQVGELNFDLSDRTQSIKKVRKLAFNDAVNKATELVAYSGKKLGSLVSIVDAANTSVDTPQMVPTQFLPNSPKASEIEIKYNLNAIFKII